MSLSRQQAIDEMSGIFKTAWETTLGFPAALVTWPNVASKSVPPAGQTPWARFLLTHTSGRAGGLSGPTGTGIYFREGLITVQYFQALGKGLSGATDPAKTIMDAYEGKTSAGGVIFRNVSTNEIGPDGDFYQVNIVANFEYDEVK